MKRAAIAAFLFGALALLTHATDAHACACCSEPGQRVESMSKLDAYEKGELERLRFGKKVRLYTTAAGMQAVKGITAPTDTYELTPSRGGDRWSFAFKDAHGKQGTLAFSLPSHIESFFVDPQDGKQQGDPVLYKEWRIAAPVVSTGVFGPSGPATIRIVLQGRGNACTSADQFGSFMLTVSGPSAQYTLFGSVTAAP